MNQILYYMNNEYHLVESTEYTDDIMEALGRNWEYFTQGAVVQFRDSDDQVFITHQGHVYRKGERYSKRPILNLPEALKRLGIDL